MNWWIAIIAIVWVVGETQYFGNNWSPKSDAEIICDGIAMVILALAFVGGNK